MVRSEYAHRSIRHAVEKQRLVPDDAKLVYEFLTYIRASQGITGSRKNEIVYLLVSWRRHLLSYRDCTLEQVFTGISTIKIATNQRGHTFQQSTIHDHIILLKRFLLWTIENDDSGLPGKRSG